MVAGKSCGWNCGGGSSLYMLRNRAHKLGNKLVPDTIIFNDTFVFRKGWVINSNLVVESDRRSVKLCHPRSS